MASPYHSVDCFKGPIHARPPRLELVTEGGVMSAARVVAHPERAVERSECAY